MPVIRNTTTKPPATGTAGGGTLSGATNTNIGSSTGQSTGGTTSGGGTLSGPTVQTSYGGFRKPTATGTTSIRPLVVAPIYVDQTSQGRQASPDSLGGGGGGAGGGGGDQGGSDDQGKGISVMPESAKYGVKQYATLALGAVILGTAGFFLAKNRKWHGWKMFASIGTGAVIGVVSGFAVIKYVPPLKAK